MQSDSATDRQASLSSLLSQLERARTADMRPRLLAESGNSMHLLEVSQIELVESDRNYVKLIIGREVFHARSTLLQAEKALQSQPMLRISRSCLININYLRQVSRTPRGDFILVLAGGVTVTSSEGFRETVRDYLGRLKLGGDAPS